LVTFSLERSIGCSGDRHFQASSRSGNPRRRAEKLRESDRFRHAKIEINAEPVAPCPWITEWYWRGVLGSESRLPVASDVAFAGYHAVVLVAFIPGYWAVLTAATLTGAAWLWRQLAARAGGLLVPVATHLLADLSVIVTAWAIATHGR
jgi:hypothetical protein